MAVYNGPKCRLCRRERQKLFLKGKKCLSANCALTKRGKNPPGVQPKMRRKMSEYAIQLREKQKVKRIYGVLERQFRRIYDIATRMKGKTGDNLMQLLERRLDNVVYRLHFAASRRQARQIVNHGHVFVNGKRVNIPSYIVKINDEISLDKEKPLKVSLESLSNLSSAPIPVWLELNQDEFKGKVVKYPAREEIDIVANEQLIVELYSK